MGPWIKLDVFCHIVIKGLKNVLNKTFRTYGVRLGIYIRLKILDEEHFKY